MGTLEDRAPRGGPTVHAITRAEEAAIVAVLEAYQLTDRSHRMLAHHGSYEGVVWGWASGHLRFCRWLASRRWCTVSHGVAPASKEQSHGIIVSDIAMRHGEAIGLAAWQPLLFKPGTQYHYSSIGYELLGLIAARLGAQPLPDLYRQRIFKPLGLRQTAYDPQGPISGPHARGYLIGVDGTMTDATDWHWGVGAAAGIVSNAPETAAFLVAAHARRARWNVSGCRPCATTSCTAAATAAVPAARTGGVVPATPPRPMPSSTPTARVAVLLLNARPYDGRDDITATRTMIALYRAA